MCGRFQLSSTVEDVQNHFDVTTSFAYKKSFNITPASYCPVIRLNNESKEVALCYWGLIPSWAKDKTLSPINAKAETLDKKPFFRNAYKNHRCIIPANGFYEWKGDKGNKQPFYFYPKSSGFFGFAGLWEIWENPDEVLESFTIITTEANSIMKSVHSRMPVILDRQDYDKWLNTGKKNLLGSYQSEKMCCHSVSKEVNNPANDTASLIRKI